MSVPVLLHPTKFTVLVFWVKVPLLVKLRKTKSLLLVPMVKLADGFMVRS